MNNYYKYHVAYFYIDANGNVGCGDVSGVEVDSNPPSIEALNEIKDGLKKLYDYSNVVILNMFLVSSHD